MSWFENTGRFENIEGKGHRFTKENASEYGKRGAEAAAKTLKRIRTMREAFKVIGDMKCSDAELERELEALGVEGTKLMAATLRIAQKAESGDVDSYKVWRDGIGESPKVSVGVAVEPQTADDLKKLSDEELARIAESEMLSDK